jgi:opacity protein-like surface antigen
MRIRSVMGSLAASAVLVAGPALAVEAQKVGEDLNFDARKTKVGLDVRLGLGGITGDLGEETGTGPLLGIAAGAQPWNALGIELGYEGQRLPITEEFVGDGEAIYRHNVGLMAKAGPLLDQKWRPYVGAGVGVSYLNVSDGADQFFDNDFISEVPLAAGLDYNFGGAIFAGARATYRLMYGEGYADNAVGNDAQGSLFNASVTLGGRF